MLITTFPAAINAAGNAIFPSPFDWNVKNNYCDQLILQDENLINVARVAPCYDACYIAVALTYGTMQTLLRYPFTQGVFLLQRVVQMCVGADSILLLQYGHVKATSQRLYRPLAVSALHIVGKSQSSEHSRFGEHRVTLGVAGVAVVHVTLAILGTAQFAKLL